MDDLLQLLRHPDMGRVWERFPEQSLKSPGCKGFLELKNLVVA